MVPLLTSTIGGSVAINVQTEASHAYALADPTQLELAILNLAINARDAMPDGGVLTIATRNQTLGAGGHVPAGDYVAVSVADTGTGMTPDVLARVFEPFFSTKGPGRGSGLGLSQVHGLAAQSGGDVRVDSRPGEGTTVTLLLPRSPALPAALPATPIGRGSPRRRGRVLVVDDDADVRVLTGEMLTERGYSVALVADPLEALEMMRSDAGFDLLLVDYVMPGMDGCTLIRQVQAFRPAQRVLLMTGNAEFSDQSIGAENIIRKPFTIARLDARLEQLLARPVLRGMPGGLSLKG
jgi:CheY-like chemotaxis protein